MPAKLSGIHRLTPQKKQFVSSIPWGNAAAKIGRGNTSAEHVCSVPKCGKKHPQREHSGGGTKRKREHSAEVAGTPAETNGVTVDAATTGTDDARLHLHA